MTVPQKSLTETEGTMESHGTRLRHEEQEVNFSDANIEPFPSRTEEAVDSGRYNITPKINA